MRDETTFAGNMPERYDRGMGPVVFEPYAQAVAERLPMTGAVRVLEVAAGTGRLTRHLLSGMPADGVLVATDLSPEMVAVGEQWISDPRLTWKVADAMELPFEDESFDLLVCQFGAMFFPDKGRAYREAWRVLKPGGKCILSVWGPREVNPWAREASIALQEFFERETTPFMGLPFSYHNEDEIVQDLQGAGFETVALDWMTKPLLADHAVDFAEGMVTGTPISVSVAERGRSTEACIAAVADRFRRAFGDEPMRTTMSALIVKAQKSP